MRNKLFQTGEYLIHVSQTFPKIFPNAVLCLGKLSGICRNGCIYFHLLYRNYSSIWFYMCSTVQGTQTILNGVINLLS